MSSLFGIGAGGNVGAAGGFYPYSIDQSLRFNDDDSAYFSRTPSSDGNRQIFTISFWMKRANIGIDQMRILNSNFGSDAVFDLYFEDTDEIVFRSRSRNTNGAAFDWSRKSVRKFRDVSSWYHIVIAVDVTVSSPSSQLDLFNFYLNGENITSNFTNVVNSERAATSSQVDQRWNSTTTHDIGYNGSSQYFDGYLAEFHNVDGTALSPTSFGETIGGVWVPKAYSGSYGTNGFYLPFAQDVSTSASTFFSDDGNSYVKFSNASHYDIGSSDDFTIEFFMWPTVKQLGENAYVFGYYGGTGGPYLSVQLAEASANAFYLYHGNGAAYTFAYTAGDVDAGRWHHVVVNRVSGTLEMFLDGSRIGSAINSNTKAWNNTQIRIGHAGSDSSTVAYDGYLSNARMVVGSAVYSAGSSITVPTSTLTAVTNTKLLALTTTTITADASSNNVTGTLHGSGYFVSGLSPFATSNFNDDNSGNNNDFAAANLAVSDVVPDSPTLNYSNIVPMANTSLSEGNLRLTTSRTGNWDGTIGSFGVNSGKWYHEVRFSKTEANFRCVAGWIGNEAAQTVTLHGKGGSGSPFGTLFDNYAVTSWLTSFYKDGGNDGTMTTPASGDVMNIAADFDNGKIWFGINGTYYANDGGTDGDPAGGTNESLSGIDLTASEYVPFFAIRSDSSAGGNVMIVNFGQEGTFAGTETDGGYSDGNGYGSFFNPVPSGFLALASANLPEPTIGPNSAKQADDYFNTVLYTGNETGQSITGVGLQPDFLWIKDRSAANHHALFDAVRGAGSNGFLYIASSQAAAEIDVDHISSLDSDGFTLGSGRAQTNNGSNTYVAWNWKAGTAFSNDASATSIGTIDSAGSVSQDAGFSIVTYTGNLSGSGTASVAHGLGVRPNMVITKSLNATGGDDGSWTIWHDDLSTDNHVLRFTATGESNKSGNGDMASLFTADTFGTNYTAGSNVSGNNYVAYCFANVDNYSKAGKWVGNGSASGPMVFTGFQPSFILTKRSDGTSWWGISDSKRSPFNEVANTLAANETYSESTLTSDLNVDFLSNGFKIRDTDGYYNASGGSYIYLAFGSSFKYANAR